MNTKTLHDNIDDFNLQIIFAQSMTFILEDMVLDSDDVSTLNIDDPMHHVQRMHACILAIRSKLDEIKLTVHGMGGSTA
jgi:hypothetical protein